MKTTLTALAYVLAVALSPAPAAAADACPLNIVPGASFGAVKLGDAVPQFAGRAPADTDFADLAGLRVKTCGGRVADVWLDDLRLAPDCVKLDGKPLRRDITLDALKKHFGDCRDLPPRIGGAFIECAGGGVRFGYGMGTFLQVRVGPKGSDLDAECADLADDGRPVPLPVAERDALLQQVLDLDILSPFWHPDRPGRRPLRVAAAGPLAGLEAAPALSIFGEPVVFESPAAAADRRALFEFTGIESSARRVHITFRYGPEGLQGSVRYQRRGDQWLLVEKQVAER